MFGVENCGLTKNVVYVLTANNVGGQCEQPLSRFDEYTRGRHHLPRNRNVSNKFTIKLP